MESGDGLIVRLRARTGMVSATDLLAIAEIAQRHGNGLIDLTRRANIQLRGVTPMTIARLWDDLGQLGLLGDNAEAEAVSNVMLNPLAGIDPSEAGDLRPLARELEFRFGSDEALWQLPAKFGFVVDGAGLLILDEERADIRLRAIRAGGAAKVAIAIDRPKGDSWLGLAGPEAAGVAAIRAAHAFLALKPGTRSRMRDLSDETHRKLQAALAPYLERIDDPPTPREPLRPLGKIWCDGTIIAAGLAVAFGRIEAKALHALANVALNLGVSDFRISPWRSLYAAVADERTAEAILDVATAHHFVVDADDPLLAIDACPGAPSCRSTELDTRAAARRLAPTLRRLNCRSLHISGCAKGCARSKPADLVLVGAGDCFGVLRYDTAQGQPHAFVPPARLSDLPEVLKTI